MLAELATRDVPEKRVKRRLVDVKAKVDQGETPDDATPIPDVAGRPAFAVTRFGYRIHLCVDETLKELTIVRIG